MNNYKHHIPNYKQNINTSKQQHITASFRWGGGDSRNECVQTSVVIYKG
jgi:hypothetical protein